jgi:peroxiredoxin
MKLVHILAVAVVALSVLTAVAFSADPAPNFKLKAADGTTVELNKLKGKVVLVNFWATWCPPCRAEIPGMMKVYDKYKAKGLEIVGISVDNGGWDDVRPWLEKHPITYPIVVGDANLAQAYGGIHNIPTTFLVDRKGNIAMKHVGGLTEEEFEKMVKKAL